MAIIIYATKLLMPPPVPPQDPNVLPSPVAVPQVMTSPSPEVVPEQPLPPAMPQKPEAAPQEPQAAPFALKVNPNDKSTWPIRKSTNPIDQIAAAYQMAPQGDRDMLLEQMMNSPIPMPNGTTSTVDEFVKNKLARSKKDPGSSAGLIARVMDTAKSDFMTLLKANLWHTSHREDFDKQTEKAYSAMRAFADFINDPSLIPEDIADDPKLSTAQKLLKAYKLKTYDYGIPGRSREAANKWNDMFLQINKLTGERYNPDPQFSRIAVDNDQAREMGLTRKTKDGRETRNTKGEGVQFAQMASLIKRFVAEHPEEAKKMDLRKDYLNPGGKYYLSKEMIDPARYEIDENQAQSALDLVAPTNKGSKPQNKIRKSDEEEQLYNSDPSASEFGHDEDEEQHGFGDDYDERGRKIKRRRASSKSRAVMAVLAASVYEGQSGLKQVVAKLLSEHDLGDVREWYELYAPQHSDSFASVAIEIMNDYSWAISGNPALDSFADDISRQRFVIRASVCK